MQTLVEKKITEWLQLGTIEKAPIDSQWNSPIIAVPKKDNNGKLSKVRLCLDTRQLNNILEDVLYTIPLIKDIFNRISGFKVASRLDLEDSFNQLPLNREDREKTTFTFNQHRYMFNGAPFGLKTLTSELQRILSRLLENFNAFCIHFVDDIVVFSEDLDSHCFHLKVIIDSLNKANFKLRIDKCLFGCTKLNILGHIITGNSISANPKKLESFKEIKVPKTGKQLSSFLGVTGYLRDYIPMYSRIAAPLEALRNKKGSLSKVWNIDCTYAIDKFKEILSSPAILSTPDFSEEFHVGTDASNSGVGGVLYQIIDGKNKFISFASSSLSDSQRNYPITKKELLAIVFCVHKFRYWLWGKHFTLYTDHYSLIYLFTGKIRENRMLSNWSDLLLCYDFTIIHCPVILHTLPDYLSRLYTDISINLVESYVEKPYQEFNKFVKERFNKVVPLNKEEILNSNHILNHQGADQLFKTVFNSGFYWNTLRADCQILVDNCEQCLRYNISRMGFHPLTTITAKNPFDHVAIDLFGPFKSTELGNTFTLLLVDICTRYVILSPLKTKSALDTGEALFKIFCNFGFPKILQSDNGTEFVNSVIESLLSNEGISHRLITPYHPEANGSAERHVALAKSLLFKLCNGNFSNWDLYLPAVQLGLNSRISRRHKSSPFSLFFGRKLNSLYNYSGTKSKLLSESELIEKNRVMLEIVYPLVNDITNNYNNFTKKSFNKSRLIKKYDIGDPVMVKNPNKVKKSDSTYVGPYYVADIDKNGAYVLADSTGEQLKTKTAAKHLKLIKNKEQDNDIHYEIDDILDHRGVSDSREYLVSWKGYDSSNNSWIPISNFDSLDLINDYHLAFTQNERSDLLCMGEDRQSSRAN